VPALDATRGNREDRAVVDAGAGRETCEAPDLREELARHHEPGFGWALACCRWNRSEAEDTLHAAYLKILEGRARFGGRSSFRTWLFGVIRTTAAERRRRRWRRGLAWRRHQPTSPAATPPREESQRDAERLRRELCRLPTRQREVLHLVFYTEVSIAEAARVMGVSLGTARTHYERGKRRLRRRLGLEDAR
jgi:RNA polymerase sigma-70 factor (ECF subfamily)